MPKVVDSDKTREMIAKSASPLLLEKGFCNLTVSDVARSANMAKGSIYNYFDSKEDILFEIIKYYYKEYDKEVIEKISQTKDIKEKVFAIFALCISNDEKNIQRRKIYREFVSVCLNDPKPSMLEFKKSIKKRYIEWLKSVLSEETKEFAEGLFVLGEGVLVLSSHNPNILIDFINNLFKKCRKQIEEKR